MDLGERGFRARVHRLRKGGNNVGADVEPAPLLFGVGEHLRHGLLEPQHTVTDRHYRCAAIPRRRQDRSSPAQDRVDSRNRSPTATSSLVLVGAHPDHHQQAHANTVG